MYHPTHRPAFYLQTGTTVLGLISYLLPRSTTYLQLGCYLCTPTTIMQTFYGSTYATLMAVGTPTYNFEPVY